MKFIKINKGISVCVWILFSAASCGSLVSPDNSQDQASGLLSLMALQCSIGGQSFIPSSGVTCSFGSASGTGTLAASSDNPSPFGQQIRFLLNSGGSLEVLGAANPGLLSAGYGYKFTESSAIAHSRNNSMGTGMGASFFSPALSVRTYCLEMHLPSGQVHSIADPTACASPGSRGMSEAAFSDMYMTGKDGNAWGYVLNNAVIQDLSVYTTTIYHM